MTTRTITKAQGGVEDLMFGNTSVNQTRNGATVAVTKINGNHIPYSGETEGVDLVTINEKIDSFSNLSGVSGVYDFDVDGGALGDHILAGIPDNTVLVEAWYEVLTAPISGGANSTIALSVATDGVNEILDPKDFDDATWMSLGYHDTLIFPRAANFTTKTTAARNIVLTIGTSTLTAGKIYFWCRYITSV